MNGFTSVKWLMACLCLAVGVFVSAPLLAQTPDGETPAEETVCDPLKADGITKGLYGLCVAFCEAKDFVSLEDPITEEQLQALLDAVPSGRILHNYNRKKQEGDPDMPCIRVEEPCPCWTTAELEAIDGLRADGNPATKYGCSIVTPFRPKTRFIYEDQHDAKGINGDNKIYYCHYRNYQTKPPVDNVMQYPELTTEEAAACLAAINERCEYMGW